MAIHAHHLRRHLAASPSGASALYGPVQLQLDAGVALLRGAGADATKSALLLLVSSKAGEAQISFRLAALAALSVGAVAPSQAVLEP